jgi:hypothetical protein
MKIQIHFSRCQSSPAGSCRFCLLLLITHLLGGFSHAGLSTEDLAAITGTGLTALTGEQGGGEYTVRDYVVVETMRIPRGDTVKFVAGTRIFLHPDARITVHGSLILEGNAKKSITIGKLPFTLLKLSSDKKMIFDSTSIFIYRGAHLAMYHTVLADSSVRVRLTDTTSTFILEEVTCTDNRFTFPDTTLVFPAKAVVTCSKENGISIPCIPVLPEPAGTPELLPADRSRQFRPMVPLRIVLGAGTAAAWGMCYYFANKAQNAYDAYPEANTPDECDRLTNVNSRNLLYRNIAAAVGGCGLVGFSVTFIFGGQRR